MATTVRIEAVNFMESLNQMYDDAEIRLPQAVYWVLNLSNTLKAQHIQKRSSGAFLTPFPHIPVKEDTSFRDPGGNPRKYIEIPTTIYDFHKDRGIDYICYPDGPDYCPPRFTGIPFSRTTPKGSQRLYTNDVEVPDAENPFFYRMGSKIYLLGCEKIPLKAVEVGLYTALDPLATVDIDAPLELPDELVSILQRQLLDLGRFALMMPKDRINDGDSANSETIPTNKIASVQPRTEQE